MFEINYSQLIQYEILEKLVTYITNYISSWCRPSVGSFHVLHQHLSISTICQKANYVETLESEPTQLIQIQVRKRHSLESGFELTTSVVPSQCTTNWAIQAWIFWTFMVGPVLPLLMLTQHTKLGPGNLWFPDINRIFPLSGHPELGEWLLLPFGRILTFQKPALHQTYANRVE